MIWVLSKGSLFKQRVKFQDRIYISNKVEGFKQSYDLQTMVSREGKALKLWFQASVKNLKLCFQTEDWMFVHKVGFEDMAAITN